MSTVCELAQKRDNHLIAEEIVFPLLVAPPVVDSSSYKSACNSIASTSHARVTRFVYPGLEPALSGPRLEVRPQGRDVPDPIKTRQDTRCRIDSQVVAHALAVDTR
jgi:hypothetical protein